MRIGERIGIKPAIAWSEGSRIGSNLLNELCKKYEKTEKFFNTGKRMPDLYAKIMLILAIKEDCSVFNNGIGAWTGDLDDFIRDVRGGLGIAS